MKPRGLDRRFFLISLLCLWLLQEKHKWGVVYAWGGPTQILMSTATAETTRNESSGTANNNNDARFGSALAADGQWLAVSATYEDNRNGKSAGAVYLYRWNDTTTLYDLVTPILAPSSSSSSSSGYINGSRTTTEYNQFGASVALSGNWLLVGAPYAQEEAGVAYLFEIYEEEDLQLQMPSFQFNGTSLDGDTNGLLFGTVVAIWTDPNAAAANDPSTILVAIATQSNGPVYVFDSSGGQKLLHDETTTDSDSDSTQSSSSSSNGFGSSLAIHETVLVVGAPESATVHIFEYTMRKQQQDYSWTETMRLQPQDVEQESSSSRFGHDVAVSENGTIIVVGATGASATYIYQKVYDNDDYYHTWSQLQKITAPPRNNNQQQTEDRFGWSVALSNNTLAVSAVAQDGVQSINAGAVYLYKQIVNAAANDSVVKYFDDDSPITITPGNRPGVAYDSFGHDITISGFALAVAAPLFDIDEDGLLLANDAGAVYVYQQLATFSPTVSPAPTIPPRETIQPTTIPMPAPSSDLDSEKVNSTASPSTLTNKSTSPRKFLLAFSYCLNAIIAFWALWMS